jgi:hypothetical protein
MSKINKPNSKPDVAQSNLYQIRVKGRLDLQWSDWFEGLTVAPDEEGNTLITGPVVDDAALHGLLKKVRDSGLRLLSVNHIENDLTNEADSEQPDYISLEHKRKT